jgi:purine-binding chemotaxis protein CheW
MSIIADQKEPGAGKIVEMQLVSFQLGDEEYGVDILKVQEINRMLAISKIPRAPEFIDGIINLRGKVIPIINLRKRFGLEKKANDKQTRIVVVNINGKVVGIVVDSVSEVLRMPSNTIEPPPSVVSSGAGADYIKGVGKIGEKLLILLDLEKLFGDVDTEMIDSLSKSYDSK